MERLLKPLQEFIITMKHLYIFGFIYSLILSCNLDASKQPTQFSQHSFLEYPLHIFTYQANVKAVKDLLAKDSSPAYVNQTNKSRQTALEIVKKEENNNIWHMLTKSAYAEIAYLLQQHGAIMQNSCAKKISHEYLKVIAVTDQEKSLQAYADSYQKRNNRYKKRADENI